MTGAERKIGQTVGQDPLAALAAEEVVDAAVAKADVELRKGIAATREKAHDMEVQAALTQEIILGEFLPDVKEAHRLALGLVSGYADNTRYDVASLEEFYGSKEGMRSYLEGFEAMDPTKEYPFPQVVFPATAIIQHNGADHYFDQMAGGFGTLHRYMFTPTFRSNVLVPTLIDPQVHSLEDIATLEPGHGAQLAETFRMANERQAGIFQDPKVVRMVAVLPVGENYATDFIPSLVFKEAGLNGWDPYLMVNGALNNSGSYLMKHMSTTRDSMPLNVNDREASFRVQRPKPGSYNEESERDIPRAPHELNSMGIILLPYKLHEAPRRTSPGSSSGSYASPTMKGGSVGEAYVGVGQLGYASAGKNSVNAFGDVMLPENSRPPVVYSVRFLTAKR